MISLVAIICYHLDAGTVCQKIPLSTPPRVTSCKVDLSQEAQEIGRYLQSQGQPVTAVLISCSDDVGA